MNLSKSDHEELNKKIRQQYDFLPYPESDLDYFPTDNFQELFIHSLSTPYYLRYQQVINTKNTIILDAGCGSGVKSLVLTLANPGAKIVGVDISEKSIELARQRLDYHGFENVEFYALSLDSLDSLGYKYDYINCDEVLYLLPNPAEMLSIFARNLTDTGIIRANLHSHYQRNAFFRSQEAFRLLGLFEEDSIDTALEAAHETLENLKDFVQLNKLYKDFSLKHNRQQQNEWILVNFLLQGDKGYTISDLFRFLDLANLDFLSMVNWRQWNLIDLFKNRDNLPLFWQLGLENTSEAEKLQLFELFHPIHRLLDFWIAKPNDLPMPVSPLAWTDSQWHSCQINLHPALQSSKVKDDLLRVMSNRHGFQISQYIPLPTITPIVIDSWFASCLLPLWEGPQSFVSLVERWLQIQPILPTTLEAKGTQQAELEIKELLSELETFTYVLLELS